MAWASSASPVPTCSPALASTAASQPLLPAAQHCPLPTARCPLHIAHCSLQAGRGLGFRRLGTWREGRTADRRAQGSAHEQQEASQEGGAGLARFPPRESAVPPAGAESGAPRPPFSAEEEKGTWLDVLLASADACAASRLGLELKRLGCTWLARNIEQRFPTLRRLPPDLPASIHSALGGGLFQAWERLID